MQVNIFKKYWQFFYKNKTSVLVIFLNQHTNPTVQKKFELSAVVSQFYCNCKKKARQIFKLMKQHLNLGVLGEVFKKSVLNVLVH